MARYHTISGTLAARKLLNAALFGYPIGGQSQRALPKAIRCQFARQ